MGKELKRAGRSATSVIPALTENGASAMGNLPNPNDIFGDDHPTITAAIASITFAGVIPIEEIDRARAARWLNRWVHRRSLTSREVDAILSRFPEASERDR